MSKAIDYDLKTSAHEVQRLMGQCILRLQVYELLLKSVVTAHEISSPIATLATAQTDLADRGAGRSDRDAVVDRAVSKRQNGLGRSSL